jgi:Protein of unknown function (DUF3494)./Bacterial Ig-like domain (group 2).
VTTFSNWSSDNLVVATVGLNTGLATGVATGTSVITATFGSKTSSATLTVTAALGSAVCTGASCVALGTAGDFVILTKTGIANTPTSAVTGDMGVTPGAASLITGFALVVDATNDFSRSAQVTGKIYAPGYTGGQAGSNGLTPAKMTTAQTDLGLAYTAATAKAAGPCPGAGGNITGSPLAAGVYTCAVNVTIPTNLTLTGTATDVWVFQITGTLTQSSATQVLLTGGALPQNVFWQVSGGVTIGTTALMQGVILSQTTIALQTGASANGRLLAQTAVTLDKNTVTQP